MIDAEALLREIAKLNPWKGDRWSDWCLFCLEEKPDHDEKCLWVRANDVVRRLTASVPSSDPPSGEEV